VPQRRTRPLIYVTPGSSGPLRTLPATLRALSTLDADVLVATAGRIDLRAPPSNVRAAKFVRGDLAAERAAAVVCNGGASTAYQALTAGTPVVGLPLNLDQYLVMDAIERAGAGILVRSGTATEDVVRAAVLRALFDPQLRAGARRAAAAMRALDAPVEFRRALGDATASATLAVNAP
jgi:UDP:flavonoid glycosyltransferase YjiC (YdhE family)